MSKNQELSSLDRLSQLERLGIASYAKRELIFRLECAAMYNEARKLIKAITNPFFSTKIANKLYQEYWIMLDQKDAECS